MFTGETLEFAGPLVMAWPINDQVKNPAHFPLTKDKARYVGDPVAVVVADSRATQRTPPSWWRSTGSRTPR